MPSTAVKKAHTILSWKIITLGELGLYKKIVSIYVFVYKCRIVYICVYIYIYI